MRRGLKVNLSDTPRDVPDAGNDENRQTVAVSRPDSVAASSMDTDPPAKKLKKSTAVEVKVTPQRNFVILEHKVNLMEALESGKATLVKDTKFRMTGVQVDIFDPDFKVHKCSLAAKVTTPTQDLNPGTEATLPQFAFFSIAKSAIASRAHEALTSSTQGTGGQFGDCHLIFFSSVEIAGMMAWLCQPSYTTDPESVMQISKHVFEQFPGFTHVGKTNPLTDPWSLIAVMSPRLRIGPCY